VTKLQAPHHIPILLYRNHALRHLLCPICKGLPLTTDVHHRLEAELATFLGTESAILYAQAFAAVSSVIPAFAKRGDIIVADRGVNFAINKGLQISRSQIKWYAHGDMKDLERVLQTVERERKRKGGKLTRKFIVAEGIFENDGMMLDLPKVVRTRLI
jgi:serine palmitoyltransferase